MQVYVDQISGAQLSEQKSDTSVAITFKVLELKAAPTPQPNVVQLIPGNWDDFSYKTSFDAVYFDGAGRRVNLGTVKIGYASQGKGWTREKLERTFTQLSPGWFSLGEDVDYYKTIYDELTIDHRRALLGALRDVVADDAILQAVQEEDVFVNSMLRGVSLAAIHDQFRRVLAGYAVLTPFKFSYVEAGSEKTAAFDLQFKVNAQSTPSTNVHVLTGRNGVGKTTLLNGMVEALRFAENTAQAAASGFRMSSFFEDKITPMPSDYFGRLVSVSFSAFDPFVPPADRGQSKRAPAYMYVGMKNTRREDSSPLPPKTHTELAKDFVDSFKVCLRPTKRVLWLAAVERLSSDPNFKRMELPGLLELDDASALAKATEIAEAMSSGHAIVLLTLTKLVETVEEKTLVLLDEPESHLHPPLLSAFTRALADLLHRRNGVAIVATHSPVVLQEVPKSCVWKIDRIGAQGQAERPERETFGENVGILTREVFNLEVSESGFHELMKQAAESGATYEDIVKQYRGQLGAEARAILLGLIAQRDSEHRKP